MADSEPARGASTEVRLDPERPLAAGAASLQPGRFLALYELGRQLMQQRDPAQVLRTVHEQILQHLAPDESCLLAAEGGALRPLAAHGLDLTGPEAEWPVSGTVIRQVRAEGVALLAADVQQDPRTREAQSLQRFRIRSVIAVPLGKPARGVAYAANRGDRPFTAEDLEFLTAVSLYASLVLESAYEHARTTDALVRSDERVDALQSELLRHRIVGAAPSLLKAYDTLRRLAKAGARVLLRGETGTGKELFARAYAAESGRRAYMPVTIPALAPSVVESELFGHVKGSFTEARTDRKGRLEVAHGGVLFLDEVGDIEPGLQTKLLRFLDSGELFRVGDNQARHVDALVVAATNRPLEKDVADGRFRSDLLARLGHAIVIPPLRERPGDIPLLVEHFLGRHGGKHSFTPEAMALLAAHDWPFNVRELQQVVERAVCLVDRDAITPDDLPDYLRAARTPRVPAAGSPAAIGPLRPVIEAAEKEHVLRALDHAQGNRRKAIEILQISPETFYKRLEEYGLHKKG
ncbi:MAG: sigma-54-dependent Fis family transcriptional regulator [Vicinamibacteria bacterium]